MTTRRIWNIIGSLATVLCLTNNSVSVARSNITDCLLCRQCGADVSDASHLFDNFSPVALLRGNQSLFGKPNVQLQLLQNPLGIRFQVITLLKASCTAGSTQWHSEFSWFPGHVWKHCTCPRCGHHLGWVFVPNTLIPEKVFYAIILDSVLSEHFSDSLMVIPRVFQS